jgi:hypothetical protein
MTLEELVDAREILRVSILRLRGADAEEYVEDVAEELEELDKKLRDEFLDAVRRECA